MTIPVKTAIMKMKMTMKNNENENNNENNNENHNDHDDHNPQSVSDDDTTVDDGTAGVGNGALPGVCNNQTREIPGVETIAEGDEDKIETDDDAASVSETMNQQYVARTGRYSMRPHRRPQYSYFCEDATQFRISNVDESLSIAPQEYSHQYATLADTVMTQHSVKQGLKIFGQAGEDTVISEMQQLHDMECIKLKAKYTMTREEKQASLRYLMFLKQKRCGRIKGRGCVDC
jgi:hypothetical protein